MPHIFARSVGIWMAVSLLSFSCASQKQAGPVALQRPLMPCTKAQISPRVDGRLGGYGWERIPAFSSFILSDGSGLANEQTKGYITYDDTCLYVGAICVDSKGDYAKADVEERDADRIREDDVIEILLDTNRDGATYIHVMVNALGTQWDEVNGEGPTSWDGKWRAEATSSTQWWQVECALPFAQLGALPQEGDIWGFNMCRCRWPGPEHSAWSCTHGAFDDPDTWGEMIFVPTSPMAELSALGDTYGDLYRSSVLQMKLSSNIAHPTKVVARADVFHKADWAYGCQQALILPAQERRLISQLCYDIAFRQDNVLTFTLSDAESGAVYYRSPAYPLRDTFFAPRIQALNQQITRLRRSGHDRGSLRAYTGRLKHIQERVQSTGRASPTEWDHTDKELRELEAELLNER